MTEKARRAAYYEATYPDGQVWRIPAHVIADNRASYYAKEDPDTTYQEEYDFAMSDSYELADWFENNMNPEDVEKEAIRVRPATPLPFADGWRDDDTERKIVWESP